MYTANDLLYLCVLLQEPCNRIRKELLKECKSQQTHTVPVPGVLSELHTHPVLMCDTLPALVHTGTVQLNPKGAAEGGHAANDLLYVCVLLQEPCNRIRKELLKEFQSHQAYMHAL